MTKAWSIRSLGDVASRRWADTTSFRRGLSVTAIALLVTAVSLTDAGGSAPTPTTRAGAASARAATVDTVTLITGDVVTYRRGQAGAETVAVTPSTRDNGGSPYFHTYKDDAGYYVIPSDAKPLIRSGAVDRELFNVPELLEAEAIAGRDDEVPVIASYAGNASRGVLRQTADRLPGSRAEAVLPTIDSVALVVDASKGTAFWSTVNDQATGPARRLDRGISRLWLDAPVRASLSESVHQVGAPDVWAAGYDGTGVAVAVLDTGVDPTHPDLAGTVAETGNFTTEPTAVDGHGHGTHVASTIAGTGAASGGARKGVAPGATILAGKVLNDDGRGATSWILEGMEWAARSQARVVNMSLGGGPTDGSDVLSHAVNTYTRDFGVLFVVSAGNDGPDGGTVSAPGAADAALTVGAVDKQDSLAWFSSRGPRRGDGLLKPEITAPGVDIVAARAAGTHLGLPEGEDYTSLSGTSMAAPHVAGAAALLAHVHPDWRSDELKAALVGSATAIDGHTFATGSGRLDVARAFRQPVSGQPATLGYGSFSWPQSDHPPATREITYRNSGGDPVTLELTADARTSAGYVAPDDALTLSADTITVPAGGTTSVQVTLHPSVGETGAFGGQVVATSVDDSSTVRTPIGYIKSVPTRRLTVRLIGSEGQPASGQFNAVRTDVAEHPANPFDQTIFDLYSSGGVVSVDLPEGVYDLSGEMIESSLTTNRTTFASELEIDLTDSDVELVLDARDGVRLRPQTTELTQPFSMNVGSVWKIGTRFAYLRGFSWGHVPGAQIYGIPSTREASEPGRFTFETHWSFAPPLVSVRAMGDDGPAMHPVYSSAPEYVQRLKGSYKLGVVAVGDGDEDDFAGKDLAGRVGLVTLTPPPTGNPYNYLFSQVPKAVRNAKAAGAAALLMRIDVPGALPLQLSPPPDAPLPVLWLRHDDGRRLQDLVDAGPVRLKVDAASSPASSYQLHYDYPGGIPSGPPDPVDRDRLTTVPMRLHGDEPSRNSLAFFAHGALPTNGLIAMSVEGPVAHTTYIGPPTDRLVWDRTLFQWNAEGSFIQEAMESDDSYPQAERRPEETWFAGPFTPGAYDMPVERRGRAFEKICGYCREGDRFFPVGYDFDGGGKSGLTSPWQHRVRMFAGGEELNLNPLSEDYFGIGYFVLPPDQATYRLEDVYDDPRGGGRHVRTSWTFDSAGRTDPATVPEGLSCVISRLDPDASCGQEPLIGLRYRMDSLRLDNTIDGGRTHRLAVTAGHHSQANGAPITEVTIQISYDDGASWQTVRTKRGPGDTAVASLRTPRLGQLSIRVTAADSAGNSVTQEIIRAYPVS